MIRALITTVCSRPQEQDQDMGSGPSETGRGAWAHIRLRVSVGARGAQLGRRFGAPCRERCGRGSGARHARRWCSGTWFRMRTVAAVENGAGLLAGSWGVFANSDLCWKTESLSCVHIRTSSPQQGLITAECVLWKLLWKSPVQSLNHMKLLLFLIIEGGNSGNVYGRKPVYFSRFSSLAKTACSNQCKYTSKRRESSDQSKGTGAFVNPHIYQGTSPYYCTINTAVNMRTCGFLHRVPILKISEDFCFNNVCWYFRLWLCIKDATVQQANLTSDLLTTPNKILIYFICVWGSNKLSTLIQ